MKDMAEITIDQLATMVNKGFSDAKEDVKQLNQKLDKVESRMGNVESRLDHVDARLGRIESDIH